MTAKEYLYTLLSTDATLVSLVATDPGNGEPLITGSWYDALFDTPQVTFTRITEISGIDFDDTKEILVTPFQVDIWVAKNQNSLPVEVRVRELLLSKEIKSKATDLHEDSIDRISITFQVDQSIVDL